MKSKKIIWLNVVLSVVILVGAACGVQPSEVDEIVEAQKVAADTGQDSTNPETGPNLLVWQGPALFAEDQTACHQLTITADNQVLTGLCGQEGQPASFLGTHRQTWHDLVARFAPFEAEIDGQRIVFSGQGDLGGAAWERAVAAWASLTYAELTTGRVSATGPTVLAWNIGPLPDQPDTCQQLIVLVYGYGMAGTMPCAGGNLANFSSGWIEPAAWEQFDAWLYEYGPVYQANSYLDGRGTAEMSEAQVEALSAWATAVYEAISETAAVGPDGANESSEEVALVEPVVIDEPALFPITNEQGRWGFIDPSGQVVVKPQYDYVERYSEGRAAVQQNNKVGFLDESGQVVVEPQYEAVFAYSEGRASVAVGVKWGLIDRTGQVIVEPQYDTIAPFHEGLARVDTFGQWGVIDTTGRMVIEPQFRSVEAFNGGLAMVFDKEGLIGYVDEQGRMVIPPRYNQAGPFPAEGEPMLAPVQVGEQWGYIDASGQMAIDPQFAYATPFAERRAIVNVATGEQPKFGYIDASGQLVIGARFDIADEFSEGLAMVQEAGQMGYMNLDGQMVITLAINEGYRFSEGLAQIVVNNDEGPPGYGYIDPSGQRVIDAQFAEAFPFTEGLAAVGLRREDGRLTYGYINSQGEMVIAPQFEYAAPFSEGLARVVVAGQTGYIDTQGRMVIEPQFSSGQGFAGGLAPVEIAGKWGYIDTSGRLVIEPQFGSALEFVDGLARVVTPNQSAYIDPTGQVILEAPGLYSGDFQEGLAWFNDGSGYGFIDTSGAVVIEPQFEMVGYFNEGRANIYENGKFGFIDRQGQIIVTPQYDGAGEFSEGRVFVLRGDKWGYIDLDGQEVIPPRFDGAWDFVDGLARVAVGRQWGLIDLTGQVVIEPQYGLWLSAPGSQAAFPEGLAAVQIGDKIGFLIISVASKNSIPPPPLCSNLLRRLILGDFPRIYVGVTQFASRVAPSGRIEGGSRSKRHPSIRRPPTQAAFVAQLRNSYYVQCTLGGYNPNPSATQANSNCSNLWRVGVPDSTSHSF